MTTGLPSESLRGLPPAAKTVMVQGVDRLIACLAMVSTDRVVFPLCSFLVKTRSKASKNGGFVYLLAARALMAVIGPLKSSRASREAFIINGFKYACVCGSSF